MSEHYGLRFPYIITGLENIAGVYLISSSQEIIIPSRGLKSPFNEERRRVGVIGIGLKPTIIAEIDGPVHMHPPTTDSIALAIAENNDIGYPTKMTPNSLLYENNSNGLPETVFVYVACGPTSSHSLPLVNGKA